MSIRVQGNTVFRDDEEVGLRMGDFVFLHRELSGRQMRLITDAYWKIGVEIRGYGQVGHIETIK